MDEKDLLQKLTNAKMKRLELRTTEQLNRQLHKELTDAEEQLSAAEKDAKNAWNKEEAVARMAKSNDLAFNNTTNYSTYLERKIVAIEDRMQKLSLTKERCNETIRTRALGHLNSIPRVSYLQRQQQLQSALLGKLAAVIERDTHANDATKEETVSNEEARLKIRAEDEVLSGQLVSLRKEIADVACEEEETGELINSCKEAKVEAAELLVKLKTELHALYDSIPDESSFGKCAEDLVAIESEIADLRQQDEGISPVMENLANAIRKLEKSHREEMENICQNSVNDKRALQEELMQIEDESFRAEFELKGILPKKEKYSRLLQQSQAGKSLDQLEEELQACNTELNVQLQQLEQELELEKVALAKEMEECQKDMDVLTAKGASEKENCQVHENSLREEESGLDAEMVEVATELLENEGALAELESKLVNIRNTKENHQQAAAVREREQPPILLQVKEEEDESVVITEIVPTAPGIAPFSPETVRKREDRKKHQHREVVHALRYSDISTDLNDNEEPIRAGRANKTGQTAKRTLKEMSAKEPSPQKIKRREVLMRAAAQAALNKQSLTFREEETVCDQDSLNESPMKEVVQPCVAPPPGFLDDSLYGSDIQNDTMDSLFMERPASNIRCIPEDIFLNTDVTSLENKTSPPGVLSDDDDKECDTSLDQSVWD